VSESETLLPLKMEPIEGSETSAYVHQTPGNYPKENLVCINFCLFLYVDMWIIFGEYIHIYFARKM
jgi:hypothetical protein